MTPEEIIDHMLDHGWHGSVLLHLIKDAIAEEREACAKVAEEYKPRVGQAPLSIADAIRARKD